MSNAGTSTKRKVAAASSRSPKKKQKKPKPEEPEEPEDFDLNPIQRKRNPVRSELTNGFFFFVPFSTTHHQSSASKFTKKDVKALMVTFRPGRKQVVIPNTAICFPETLRDFIRPDINADLLGSQDFNVGQIRADGSVQTFFHKLRSTVRNSREAIGTEESNTDTLVDDLLRIVGLNVWPLWIRNHPLCRLFIQGEAIVSANPEFLIKKRDKAMVVAEDKHLKNITPIKEFGEVQIAGEILTCADENMRESGILQDQTVFAVRIISTCVTFYKANISASYLEELDQGLPQSKSVVIDRWPGENALQSGLNLAEPNGRREVFEALVRLSEHMLQY